MGARDGGTDPSGGCGGVGEDRSETLILGFRLGGGDGRRGGERRGEEGGREEAREKIS